LQVAASGADDYNSKFMPAVTAAAS
jgi:hypothetical protein